ncbi:uncharacterized protein LOC106053338 [Biomphalaria glabrata]|uniref:Uncharacterized protein LOC106053338 n=1 Tax=Biomphalaria glabrata TaxID=6526 RepID=A0A9W2YUZ9_BIOGL|nr:uncharacterized protein LOC106053338 [Biomphalaria glabrata]KAI8780415.1 type-1 angiotensin II receptor B [Biomphalaria glabrata]
MGLSPEEEEVQRLYGEGKTFLLVTSIVFATFGIPGNILAALAVRHRKLRDTDLTMYWVSLCLFNTLSIAIYFLRHFTSSIVGKDVKDLTYYMCGIWILLCHLSFSIVSWHHVALVVNRTLYFTLELKDLQRKWPPHYTVTAICLFCGAYNVFITNFGVTHTFSERPDDGQQQNGQNREGEVKYEHFVTCELGPSKLWPFLIFFFNAVLPAVAVVVLNLYLMHLKSHPTSLVIKRNGPSSISMRRKLMKIIVIYNFMFVVSILPFYIVNFTVNRMLPATSTVKESKALLALHTSQALILANQAAPLYLSCAYSHRFRRECFQFLLPVLVKFNPELEQYRMAAYYTKEDSEGSFITKVSDFPHCLKQNYQTPVQDDNWKPTENDLNLIRSSTSV